MGIIVGSRDSFLQCDYIGCHKESKKVSGDNSGQGLVVDAVRKDGWQYTTNGKAYCPEHAYKN